MTRGRNTVWLVGVTLFGRRWTDERSVARHGRPHRRSDRLETPGRVRRELAASRSQFGTFLEAGIEIHEYEAGLLHAKTMTVDGIWATIGSTNLDTRSFALNEELNAVLYGQDVAGQLEKIFADDLTYSRKVDYATWQGRGFFNRLLELLSVPVRGQM